MVIGEIAFQLSWIEPRFTQAAGKCPQFRLGRQAIREPTDLLEPGMDHEAALPSRQSIAARACQTQAAASAFQIGRSDSVQPAAAWSRQRCQPQRWGGGRRAGYPGRGRAARLGEPIRIAVLIDRGERRQGLAVGERRSEQPGERLGQTGFFGLHDRLRDQVQGMDGARQRDVQHTKRFACVLAITSVEQFLQIRRQQPMQVAFHIAAHQPDRTGRSFTAGDVAVGLSNQRRVELGENYDVVLQPFRFVDRGDADIGRRRIGRSFLANSRDEIAGSQSRCAVVCVGARDQLAEPPPLASVAVRSKQTRPVFDRAAIAVLDQPLTHRRGGLRETGRRTAMRRQAKISGQPRMAKMEVRDRVPRMIGEFQRRQHHLNGRRIHQRIAPFLARRDSQFSQTKNQFGDCRVAAYEHANAGPGRLRHQLADSFGGVRQQRFVVRRASKVGAVG